MSGPLEGRVAAVTGSGRGLGLAVAEALVERGARVVAHHRSPSKELEALEGRHPGRVEPVGGDLSEEGTAVAIADAAKRFGSFDALVCNAGASTDRLLVRTSIDDWDSVLRNNLRSAFLATKHALRPMMRQRSGRIVYVSSVAAFYGNPGQSAYAAAKAGLSGLSLSVAQEYGPYHVKTAVVAPGMLDTGMAERLSDDQRGRITGRSLGRFEGSTGRTAETVAFLCGPGADNVNATTIHVDGGVKYP
ncbi:SDR family NAD(P)-dependent oxidoreductase [Glycomyces xiaoerkulensis]|uniref:SDR family NAD(P)-dependent oxidoreductase n=1 Tax=Glycomyces xiaoerkulensis TaxID=2038139 RepID=UPI000C25B973|nr:SDR family NAD(P)-dependent oxidoreductase [Glycomyces xiaoerkulensis]